MTVHDVPITLAQAVLDAWQSAMADPDIPERMKVKFALHFIGVPDMAQHEVKHLKVAWPHPVPNTTHKDRGESNEVA